MTVPFTEIHKDDAPVVTAADGSTVRILSKTHMASSIHVAIEGTSNAIYHQSRDEVWYVISGEGEMWRRSAQREAATIKLTPGMSFTNKRQGGPCLQAWGGIAAKYVVNYIYETNSKTQIVANPRASGCIA